MTNTQLDFCPISTCTNFWNIDRLHFNSEGYIEYKGQDVEHFNADFACSAKGREAAITIVERCKFLEKHGIKVNSTNTVWEWSGIIAELVRVAEGRTAFKELIAVAFLEGDIHDDIKKALKYRGYDLYNEEIDLQEFCSKQHVVKVCFDNDDSISTEINGTVKSISEYYAFGKTFNLGIEGDKMVSVTSLEFLA